MGTKYPDIVTELIDTIPEWGYWKDYFILLLHSKKNYELTNYIYALVMKQILSDWNNYNNKKIIIYIQNNIFKLMSIYILYYKYSIYFIFD